MLDLVGGSNLVLGRLLGLMVVTANVGVVLVAACSLRCCLYGGLCWKLLMVVIIVVVVIAVVVLFFDRANAELVVGVPMSSFSVVIKLEAA